MRLKSFFEEETANGDKTRTKAFTCAHCSRIHAVPRSTDDFGFCRKCYRHVCLSCGGTERCTPFEKKIEEYEKRFNQRARFLQSL